MLFPRIRELFAWRRRLFERVWKFRGYRWASMELVKTGGNIEYVLKNGGPESQFRLGVLDAVNSFRNNSKNRRIECE